MPVMVALLRGVNVGGKTNVSMSELREMAEMLGYEHVRTYVRSGNLVFSTTQRSTAAVADELAEAIAASTSVAPAVVVRTRQQLDAVVARNPFLRRGEDADHLHVMFLSGSAKASVGVTDIERFAPEEAAAVGRQLYLFLPNGVGRSKLAGEIAKRKEPAATMRNWRTVTTLQEMTSEPAR